jgi:hypothetical protein
MGSKGWHTGMARDGTWYIHDVEELGFRPPWDHVGCIAAVRPALDAEEKANKIVRACNAYDALVALAKRVSNNRTHGGPEDDCMGCEARAALLAAVASDATIVQKPSRDKLAEAYDRIGQLVGVLEKIRLHGFVHQGMAPGEKHVKGECTVCDVLG